MKSITLINCRDKRDLVAAIEVALSAAGDKGIGKRNGSIYATAKPDMPRFWAWHTATGIRVERVEDKP